MEDKKFALLLEFVVPVKTFACNFREASQYHQKEGKFMTAVFAVDCSIT